MPVLEPGRADAAANRTSIQSFLELDGDGIGAAGAASMASVPMAFSWAVAYFHLCGWLDGRLSSRRDEAVASFVAATGVAAVIQAVYRPWWTPLSDRPVTQLIGVVGVLALSRLLLHLPAAERAPASAIPTQFSLVAQVATVVVIVCALFATPWLPGATGVAVALLLATVPRLTAVITVGAHLTNGARSARQIVAGLPLGVTIVVLWSYALMGFPGSVADGWVLPAAFIVTVAWCGVLTVGYLRVFGVYRAGDGVFLRPPQVPK